MRRLFITLIILSFSVLGCSTVQGPDLSKTEVQAITTELERKAFAFKVERVKKVHEIGYRIVKSIPQEDLKVASRPFLGLFCLNRDKITVSFYQKHNLESGVFVGFVIEDTAAYAAGLQASDLILKVNDRNITNTRTLHRLVDRLKLEEKVLVSIERAGQPMVLEMMPETLPVNVRFSVFDKEEINAGATKKSVMVTYGLFNFVQSDDEIAAVLGHELAHVARGHYHRKWGSGIVKNAASLGLGVTASIFFPGAGGAVSLGVDQIGNAFGAKFSRDLEREADYFGVKYMYLAGYDPDVAADFHERFAVQLPKTMSRNYFNTHPSSPERTLRMRKIVEEIRQSENNPS